MKNNFHPQGLVYKYSTVSFKLKQYLIHNNYAGLDDTSTIPKSCLTVIRGPKGRFDWCFFNSHDQSCSEPDHRKTCLKGF